MHAVSLVTHTIYFNRQDLSLLVQQPNDGFKFRAQGALSTVQREDNGSVELQDVTTRLFRYTGESSRAEAFFAAFGTEGHFAKPLLLLRTQYHKLDRIP